jgi:hypothetical protein
MRSTQLEKALKFHRATRNIFGGVLPCNRLPRSVPANRDMAYIVNTHPSYKSGQHWCAFFFTAKYVFYFDSYGLPPSKPSFRKMMTYRKHKKVFGRRLQGMGKMCGHYCLYFILAMTRGYTFSCFTDDFNANDRYVKKFVERHFPLSNKSL